MLRCYHVRMRILSKLLRPFCAAVLATGLSGCNTASTVNETVSIAPENPVVETEYVFEPISALAAVNAARIHHRVSAVEEDDRLMQAARTHADLMGRTGKYGHEIGPGTKFKSRIFAVGFVNSAGENIGVGYRNVDQAIDGWLNSPEHKKILLKKKFNVGGIAFARNTSGRNKKFDFFWVLILGVDKERG